MVARNHSLDGKSYQNSPWFCSLIHRETLGQVKILLTWRKRGKLWDVKGVWGANQNESNLRLHGTKVGPFWDPMRGYLCINNLAEGRPA